MIELEALPRFWYANDVSHFHLNCCDTLSNWRYIVRIKACCFPLLVSCNRICDEKDAAPWFKAFRDVLLLDLFRFVFAIQVWSSQGANPRRSYRNLMDIILWFIFDSLRNHCQQKKKKEEEGGWNRIVTVLCNNSRVYLRVMVEWTCKSRIWMRWRYLWDAAASSSSLHTFFKGAHYQLS